MDRNNRYERGERPQSNRESERGERRASRADSRTQEGREYRETGNPARSSAAGVNSRRTRDEAVARDRRDSRVETTGDDSRRSRAEAVKKNTRRPKTQEREEVRRSREEAREPRNDRRPQKEKSINYFDYSFLFIIIFMLCFGTLMLYSASSYSSLIKHDDSTYYLKRQIFALAIGMAAMVWFTLFDYRTWRKFTKPLFWFSIFTVTLVWSPFGIKLNGARRWVDLGFTSFQPAEFVKLTTILFIAHLVTRDYFELNKLKVIGKILFTASVGAGAVTVLTSNLSSGIIIFAIAFIMVFVASPKYRPFFITGGAAVGLVVVFLGAALATGSAFRIERFHAWLDPVAVADEKGYQILQGLYAIGSGDLFGKGLGQSVQKMGYIPEAQNDYVFTIICEELGLVGALGVILLFIFIIKRMADIAENAPDLFASMIVIGVMAQISVQVILNIAVVTNSMPNTGVTLPFISYGGTSLAFLMSEVGLVLSVSRRIKRLR